MPSIYLASPLGFAESTRSHMDELVAKLRAHVHVHNPWESTWASETLAEISRLDSISERTARLAEVNRQLGEENRTAIDTSDALFAVLDGVDVDSGTASEIGYAFAKNKYVCGLRTDFRLAGDNHGAIVNLQVEYFIHESGGRIVTRVDELVALARELNLETGAP